VFEIGKDYNCKKTVKTKNWKCNWCSRVRWRWRKWWVCSKPFKRTGKHSFQVNPWSKRT